MLVGSPWTSLEWTKGSSIRYLLPFLVLWPLLWFSSIFTESWPWHRLRPRGAVVGGSALWLYVTHQAMPGLSADTWYPIIDTRALLVAGGVAGLGLMMGSYPRFRRLGVSVLAIGMTALVVLFARSAAMVQPGATAPDAMRGDAERACEEASLYRGMYAQVTRYHRDHGMSCPSTRFFVLSRFDQPIELQHAAFSNVVFQLTPKDYRGPLSVNGPRRGQCDAVVVTTDEAEYYGEGTLATRLGVDGQLTLVGGTRYRAYVVR